MIYNTSVEGDVMYKISVPLNSDKTASECDAVLKQLKRARVDRVFLSIGQYKTDGEERKKDI